MKIRGTISNDLDFDKCYLKHDPEQNFVCFQSFTDHHRLGILYNANACGSIISNFIIRKVMKNLMKKYFIIVF